MAFRNVSLPIWAQVGIAPFAVCACSADSSSAIAPASDQPPPVIWPTTGNVDPSPGYVRIPGGQVHSSCVHEVPHLGAIDGQGSVFDATGTLVAHHDPCAYAPQPSASFATESVSRAANGSVPSTHGWLEGVQQTLPAGATTWNFYQSYISVPPEPREKSDQTLYYWGGVQPASNDQVLQPVLQWGPSEAGGGRYWAFASWKVGKSGAYHTPLMRVSAGDVLLTQVYLRSAEDKCVAAPGPLGLHSVCGTFYTWAILGIDLSSGQEEGQWVQLTPSDPWTGSSGDNEPMTFLFPAVYEAWNQHACGDPGGVVFSEIMLAANVDARPTDWVFQKYHPTSCTAFFDFCRSTEPSCSWGTSTKGTSTVLW